MNSMLKIFLLSAVSLFLIPYGSIAEDAPALQLASPQAEIQHTIDAVVEIAQKMAGPEKTTERRKRLREVIDPRFDFAEMSKRSMGSNWSQLKPEQQKEFSDIFSELLARTYLSKIETVKPGMVKLDSEKVEVPRALVRTLVTNKGDVFPIEYRLYALDGHWKVYDVVIENIGLVANYRNEFAGIMRKDGFEGLMQKLKEKNAAAASKS